MIVSRTSVFPASRAVVFEKIRRFETLRYIAAPYASFDPVGETADLWKEGAVSSFRFRLFGFIPFGIHRIRIIRFEPDEISSREGNRHVPVGNHDILMTETDDTHTAYTDRVEIRAGWKTVVVWLWAQLFYAHRQRRWIRLLEKHPES